MVCSRGFRVTRATALLELLGQFGAMTRRFPILALVPSILALVLVCVPAPARAQEARPLTPLAPPVDHSLGRAFEPPATEWGPGHRGIDYGVVPGVKVRAAGAGRVTFAGSVAGGLYVTIDHGGGLETTYSILSEIFVTEGETVDQSRFVGLSGHSHRGQWAGLHFGVKLDDAYVDPLDYLGPMDVTGAIHLAPLIEEEAAALDDDLVRAGGGAGTHLRPCRPPRPLTKDVGPPNDNVSVAIAGVASSTSGPLRSDLYSPTFGPRSLGYGARRSYTFSYRGTQGPRLHEPYEPRDTEIDLRTSAAQLRRLLAKVARRHPNRDVDLIAHSQGGLVARVLLAGLARSWDPQLPRVEHLITLATPHRGVPLAAFLQEIETDTLSGRWVNRALKEWADHEGPVPDPHAPGVRQQVPGSSLERWLATEDTTFGTRVLSLVEANDLVVPAPRARFEGKTSRVLPAEHLDAHDAIIRSPTARAEMYSFLRDAADSCESSSSRELLGEAIDFVERHGADIYGEVELGAAGKALRAARAATRAVRSVAGRAGRGLGRAVRWTVVAGGRLGRSLATSTREAAAWIARRLPRWPS